MSYGEIAFGLVWPYRRAILGHWLTALIALFVCVTAYHWASRQGVHGFWNITWFVTRDIYREIAGG